MFDPAELAALLHLPDGVVTLGWLCLGWPDERPPAPGLERAGWSRRAPLADVVLRDRWPADDVEPPVSRLRAPAQAAVVGVRDEADRLLSPPSSLGVLDRAVDRVLALGSRLPRRATGRAWCWWAPTTRSPPRRLGLPRDGHPRRAARLPSPARRSASSRRAPTGSRRWWSTRGSTARSPVRGSPGPSAPRGDLVTADALTEDDAAALVEAGRALGRAAAAYGPVVLGEVGVGNTTVAAALAARCSGSPPRTSSGWVPVPTRRWSSASGPSSTRRSPAAPAGRPTSCSPPSVGARSPCSPGSTLGAAAAGEAVVLDGLATSVAALLAVRHEPAVAAHLVAGHRSREVAHPAVLQASSVSSRCSTCGCGRVRGPAPPSRPECCETP